MLCREDKDNLCRYMIQHNMCYAEWRYSDYKRLRDTDEIKQMTLYQCSRYLFRVAHCTHVKFTPLEWETKQKMQYRLEVFQSTEVYKSPLLRYTMREYKVLGDLVREYADRNTIAELFFERYGDVCTPIGLEYHMREIQRVACKEKQLQGKKEKVACKAKQPQCKEKHPQGTKENLKCSEMKLSNPERRVSIDVMSEDTLTLCICTVGLMYSTMPKRLAALHEYISGVTSSKVLNRIHLIQSEYLQSSLDVPLDVVIGVCKQLQRGGNLQELGLHYGYSPQQIFCAREYYLPNHRSLDYDPVEWYYMLNAVCELHTPTKILDFAYHNLVDYWIEMGKDIHSQSAIRRYLRSRLIPKLEKYPPKDAMTVEEVSEYLGISDVDVARLGRAGVITRKYTSLSFAMYGRESVLKYKESRKM